MEYVSNPFCFANITHKIVQKHTEYATLYPIKTAFQRPGSAHMLCPFVGPLPNAESLTKAAWPRSYRSLNDTFLSFATPTTRRLHPY